MLYSLALLATAPALMGAQGYGSAPAAPAVKTQSPAAAAQTPPAAAGVSSRSLKDVPNITIKYYDVSGKDMRTINRSIAKQRPKDPATKQPLVGGTNWTLDATLTKRTTNGQCTVIAAKGQFAAAAELPRLVTEKIVPFQILESWKSYVAQLEKSAANSLWFVHDRVRAVESAMVGKPCDAAAIAGNAAIAQLKRDDADFQRRNATAAATTE